MTAAVAVMERPCCEAVEAEEVKSLLEKKLETFEDMCNLSGIVEIDGITDEGKIKVLNHSSREAYEIDVDTIVKTPIKDLMLALETGVHIRLFGITRIVGYLSRVNNWNSSKIAELRDRRKGNYWENQRTNSERLELLDE